MPAIECNLVKIFSSNRFSCYDGMYSRKSARLGLTATWEGFAQPTCNINLSSQNLQYASKCSPVSEDL